MGTSTQSLSALQLINIPPPELLWTFTLVRYAQRADKIAHRFGMESREMDGSAWAHMGA